MRRCDTCHEGWPNLCRFVVFAGHGTTDGALRTYMAWPERCLVPMPDNVTDAEGQFSSRSEWRYTPSIWAT